MAIALLAGCAVRPLHERAIRARGGTPTAFVMRGEARLYVGAPGTWQFSRAFLAPDRYAWKIVTAADPLFFLFDGAIARAFVGSGEVSVDASPAAPLRTQARWTAVINLDALHEPGIDVAPVSSPELPAGVREGLRVTFPDGSVYRLGFDQHALIVWARGPLDLSPFGKGEVTARFRDHRRVGARWLPFAISYSLDSVPIAEEQIHTACIDPPGLTPESFIHPARMPDCP